MEKLYLLAFLILIFSIAILPMTLHAQINQCNNTPYPQICNSLVNNSNISQKLFNETNLEFRDLALKITLDHAQKVHSLISSMDFTSLEELPKVAWEDCLVLYEDTVHQLNQTHLSSNGYGTVDDIQTFLSAASTNLQTCENGFVDLNVSMNSKLYKFNLVKLSQLLANALAINGAILNTSYNNPHTWINVSGGGGRRRRLLANGFPSWVSKADHRRLLQTSASNMKADLVVAKDGTGNYETISEAIAAAKGQRKGRFIIHIKSGFYHENVLVTKTMRNLMLVGDGIGATIVTGSKNVIDGSTTYGSATFAVDGDGFIAKDITFENTAGPQKHQAVALRSGSDLAIFYHCSFKGYQDTLYAFSKRQFYRECDIYGTVDFIFGNAAAVFQSCNIYPRKSMSNQKNTIIAQGRSDPNQNTGIVIHDSIIEATSDLKPVQGSIPTFLGRPWMKYSRAVVMKSNIDRVIHAAGWTQWSGDFALDTLYFGEYMNSGPGASTAGRVNWAGFHVITSPIQAGKFAVRNFLAGGEWIGSNGVPFTSGL